MIGPRVCDRISPESHARRQSFALRLSPLGPFLSSGSASRLGPGPGRIPALAVAAAALAVATVALTGCSQTANVSGGDSGANNAVTKG